MNGVTIETDRFLLRTLTVIDVGTKYYSWINSPAKSQYIVYAKKERTIDELKEYVEQRVKSKSALLFGIFDIINNEHIGNIKYEPIDFENRTALMGILIGDESYRGKGVASEVINVSANWLWNVYGISKVFLGVESGNNAAISAYKKAGFRETASLKSNNMTISMVLTNQSL